MEFDWARLPEDILFEIAMQLVSVAHLVVFSAACSSWRAVYAKVKHAWTPRMPWLILSQARINIYHQEKRRKCDNHLCFRNVFDPNVNKIYRLRLPRTFDRRCWGCVDGWICTLGIDMEFDLINPLTKNQLCLPSAETLPLVEPNMIYDYENAKLLRRKYIKRVNLFTIPPNNELVVIVIYTLEPYANWAAFAKPGDSMWKSLGHVKVHDVLDVASFEGQIMMLYRDGTLSVLDMDVFQHPEQKALKDVEYMPTSKTRFYAPTYLVESFGRLLSVGRVNMSEEYDDDDDDDDDDEDDDDDSDDDVDTEDEDEEDDDDIIENYYINGRYRGISYKTQEINVHMFDFEAREWMPVDDLGDVALFVGNNSTMSLRASEAVNCNRNCIYFTDDTPHDDVERYLGQDMGIYNLKDSSAIEDIYNGDYVLSKFCPPFWYMPKLV